MLLSFFLPGSRNRMGHALIGIFSQVVSVMSDPFEAVASVLPYELRRSALSLTAEQQRMAEEIRLRVGYPVRVVIGAGEITPSSKATVMPDDLQTVLEMACEHSVHAALERMRSGFITVRGGHRIGICGEVIAEQGKIIGFRRPSSLNLRIAREVKGASAGLAEFLIEEDRLTSTLIIGLPGAGKTTLLRDLIRSISMGDGVPPHRVGVVDERGELAAVWNGAPQMELGPQSDVLDGVPKAEGMLFLLRGMNPQVLAVDEITNPEDIPAILQVSGCGTAVLATIHGKNWREVLMRPAYQKLMEQRIFRKAVMVNRTGTGERKWKVEEITC